MNYHAMDLRKGRFSQSGNMYLITTTTVNRSPVFDNFDNARLLINILKESDFLDYTKTIGFVVMPDHLHWLAELKSTKTLSEVVKQVKGKSSFLINQRQQQQGKIWQAGFHDRCLRKEDDILHVMRYLVANPLRAGIAKSVSDYPDWDCVYV